VGEMPLWCRVVRVSFLVPDFSPFSIMRISFCGNANLQRDKIQKNTVFQSVFLFSYWHPFCKHYKYEEGTMEHANGRKKGKLDFGVYHFAFETAVEIFKEVSETSKNIPEEKIFLTEQVIKHSKGVCVNLAEAWIMKKKEEVFLKKLSDAAQDASRTQACLRLALKHNYICKHTFRKIDSKYEDIFQMLCNETTH
jgi:four helix bundle protein